MGRPLPAAQLAGLQAVCMQRDHLLPQSMIHHARTLWWRFSQHAAATHRRFNHPPASAPP